MYNLMFFKSLESKNNTYQVDRGMRKYQVHKMGNSLLLWKDEGSQVEKITWPIQKSSKSTIIKVYDSVSEIKMCKKTKVNGEDRVVLNDEPGIVKIFKDSSNKLLLENEYLCSE